MKTPDYLFQSPQFQFHNFFREIQSNPKISDDSVGEGSEVCCNVPAHLVVCQAIIMNGNQWGRHQYCSVYILVSSSVNNRLLTEWKSYYDYVFIYVLISFHLHLFSLSPLHHSLHE